MRRLKKQEVSNEEYTQEFSGVMWPLRKNPKDLEPKERELLERVFARAPEMAPQAYALREELTAIFERKLTKAGGKLAIQAWCKRVQEESGLSCFESFLRTVERWLEEITNYYFDDRETSGFVEGFNDRVKVSKRRCYGIFEVGRIFQRLI